MGRCLDAFCSWLPSMRLERSQLMTKRESMASRTCAPGRFDARRAIPIACQPAIRGGGALPRGKRLTWRVSPSARKVNDESLRRTNKKKTLPLAALSPRVVMDSAGCPWTSNIFPQAPPSRLICDRLFWHPCCLLGCLLLVRHGEVGGLEDAGNMASSMTSLSVAAPSSARSSSLCGAG